MRAARGRRFMPVKAFFSLLGQAFEKWNRDKAAMLGAALAYYESLSLAPLLFAFLSLIDFCCSEEFDSSALGTSLEMVMGPAARRAIEELIRAAHSPTEGVIAPLISLGATLIGAAAMFSQLQD